MRAAAIYDARGPPVREYAPPGSSTAAPPPLAGAHGHEFRGRTVVVSRPILFQGATTGTVVLQSDLEEIAARLVRYVSLVALVSAISFLLALRVSSRFQSLISRPILRLAEAARRISREKDYAVRVEPEGRDEVGELIETFNEMLAGIQERDADLRDARSSLEQRVEERTQELQRELQERRRAEQELTKSQMLLAEAQRLAHVGSWEWDARTVTASPCRTRPTACSAASRRELAATYETFLDAIHPTDRPRVREGLAEAVEQGGEWSGEFRIVPPEGRAALGLRLRQGDRGTRSGPPRLVGHRAGRHRPQGGGGRARPAHPRAGGARGGGGRAPARRLPGRGGRDPGLQPRRRRHPGQPRPPRRSRGRGLVRRARRHRTTCRSRWPPSTPTPRAWATSGSWRAGRRAADNAGGVLEVMRTGEPRLYPTPAALQPFRGSRVRPPRARRSATPRA